jgi:chromosome partitioning protein
MEMKTLAIVNQKGGVWKTTTAVTVAHGLALCGLDVLLVDLDAQGNVADCLGLKKGPGLHDFLLRGAGLQAITESGRPHLDVIMGDPMTAEMKRSLAGDPFGIFKLRDALVDVASEYDVCVLDAAPGADILQMGALVACSHFLVPVGLADLAVIGAVDALGMVASLKKHDAFKGQFLGVLPTQWERTTSESQYQLEMMTSKFGNLVWPPIPVDTKAREAPRYGLTVLEYAMDSRAVRGVQVNNGRTVGGYAHMVARLRREMRLEDGRLCTTQAE